MYLPVPVYVINVIMWPGLSTCVYVCTYPCLIYRKLSTWGHAFSKGGLCDTCGNLGGNFRYFSDFKKLGQYDLLYIYGAIA